jgi:hypothetical protein
LIKTLRETQPVRPPLINLQIFLAEMEGLRLSCLAKQSVSLSGPMGFPLATEGYAMRKSFVFFTFALTVVTLAWFVLWLMSELAIDGCLDRGGRWNYEVKACEGIADR